jgi:hypothetical protein
MATYPGEIIQELERLGLAGLIQAVNVFAGQLSAKVDFRYPVPPEIIQALEPEGAAERFPVKGIRTS